jgi:hypothetical protein
MYPHIFNSRFRECDTWETEDANWWFWMSLNNFDGDLNE